MAGAAQAVYDWFGWFYVPGANNNLATLEATPGVPHASELWAVLPLAAVMVLVRRACARWASAPLGEAYGISALRERRQPRPWPRGVQDALKRDRNFLRVRLPRGGGLGTGGTSSAAAGVASHAVITVCRRS